MQPPVSADILDKIRMIKYNAKYYIEKHLKIRNKNSQLIPFKFNSTQNKLEQKITAIISENRSNRIEIIILKARQIGISTVVAGIIFHRCATRSLIKSLIVGHLEKASINLFNMAKLYFESLPETLRPMHKASNAKELIFENPTKNLEEKEENPGLRSGIEIATAKDLSAGRSGTINILHATEIAFWDHADETMLSLMQSVPNANGSIVFMESTANGIGNYFHKKWVDAIEGNNDAIPVFFAWFEHEEYTMTWEQYNNNSEGNEYIDLINNTYGNEQIIRELYKLTNEQMIWRRWCIKNNCGGNLKLFQQEYPACWEEAFMSSGNPRFSIDDLQWYKSNRTTHKPILEGEVIEDDKIVPLAGGCFRMYRKYDPTGQYVWIADVAEGLDKGDYSHAKGYDRLSGLLVAEWHGHIEHAAYGSIIARLGRIYNHAILVVECNNHGHSTITQIKNVEKYPNTLIFEHNVISREKEDDDYNNPEHRYGWRTTNRTRPMIINNLAQMILDRLIPEFTPEDLSELYSFVIKKGKAQAEDNCFDDRVMVLAITWYLMINETFNMHYPIKKFSHWMNCQTCEHNIKKDRIDIVGRCEESGRYTKPDQVCCMWCEINYSYDIGDDYDYQETEGE